MKFRAAGIVVIALLLCGCSDADWDNVMSFGPSTGSESSADQVAPGYTPLVRDTAVAPQPSYSVTETVTTETPMAHDTTDSYCRKIAQSSGADATRDGMDGPAQQQAADATYKECDAFYGKPGR